jgi:hypothetical protein
MAVFTDRIVPERVQPFWAALQRGEFVPMRPRRSGPTARRARGGWPPAAGCVRVAVAT